MLTESQLRERKKGIGGSDAAAICGLSRWRTPFDIYIDKTTDYIVEQEENQHMYWGNILEPIIVKKYEEETNKIVNTQNKLMKSNHYPFMLSNIDGFIPFDGAVLECKTSDSRSANKWGENGSDFFPEEYLIQCAHYAIIYDAPYVDLAVLIGGNDFRIYTYNRNENLESLIIKAEDDFWNNNVLKGVPPLPRTEDDLNKMIIETQSKMKNVSLPTQKLIELVNETDVEIQQLKEKREKMSFEIKKTISDHEGLVDDFGNILCTWKFQESNRFDVSQFKIVHPDIYEKFIKKSKSRVFRVRRD